LKFIETSLPGAFLIEPVRLEDERGFFARTFCQREFEEHGLNPRICQCNISYNRSEGALRGLHYQKPPDPEAKLVKCIRGAIYDVIVDLRPGSPSFAKWYAAELSGDNRTMLYVPEGFGHGFQTLTGDAEVLYQMSEFYKPEATGGIRWNDPRLGIVWPRSEPILSARDRALPLLDEVFAVQ
jgi:dTDP-4-dehydrorhamnose 3,5-epimerase